MTDHGTGRAMARCIPCNKASYASRADAKTTKRRLGMKAAGNKPYPCPHQTGIYHLGHLHPEVIAGHVSRTEVYGMADAEKWARELVAKRSYGLCEVCGGHGYEFSHRRTRSVRDDHTWCPCNGINACRTCHAEMHAAPAQARAEGLHVSRYNAEPFTVPTKLSVGWAMLDCEGGGVVVPAERILSEYGLPRLLGVGESIE